MRPRTWVHLWQEALIGIWRNGFMSLASVTTVGICLTVLALILLVAVNLQFMADAVESQVEIVAYIDEEHDRRLADVLVERIKAVPGVLDASLVTREEGLERLREQFGDQAYLLEGLEDPSMNPLRDAVEVRLEGPEFAFSVAERVVRLESVDEVSHRQDIVDRLLAVTRILRVAGLALVILLGAATIFIVSNTIRLTVYARRREITIMKLVGATDGFIRWPFFIEGLILGLAGAAIASLAAWVAYDYVVQVITQAVPFLPVAQPDPLVWNLAKLLLAIGAAMGAIGSSISVRRFLSV